MVRKEIRIRTGGDFMTASAAEFIAKASEFKSSVWVERNDKKANAKSMLGLLALGLTPGVEVLLASEGEDEDAAIEELGEFLELSI